jgi:hypothetical protein
MLVHGYTQFGDIEATIDDIRVFVPDNLSNRHRQMIAEWEALGNTIPPYVPPEPVPAEVDVKLFAAAYNLQIVDYEIQSLTAIDSSIFGLAWIDVGYYECYLTDVFDTLTYFPKVWNHGLRMEVIEKTPDYFVITSTDENGNPADPESFNVEITTIG